jgi:uncharacterized membrane protein
MAIIVINACKKDDSVVPDTSIYFPKVKAIIQANCISCHSSADLLNWQGRPVALDTDSQIASLYSSIKASVADPATLQNKRMPQGGTLSASDIDIIVKWYNKGGKVSD